MTGEEMVRLEIINKEVLKAREIEGYVEFGLEFLKDQLVHDVWADVKRKAGENFQGKLHLTVQWIHSNKTFYADFLTKIQGKISVEHEEKARLEAFLEHLREPHGILKDLDPKALSTLPREEEMRPAASVLMASMIAPVAVVIEAPYSDPAFDIFVGHNAYWSIFLIIAIVNNAFRENLLNQCVGVIGLCCELLLPKKEVIGKIKALIVFLAISVVHDLIWLIILGHVSFISILHNLRSKYSGYTSHN